MKKILLISLVLLALWAYAKVSLSPMDQSQISFFFNPLGTDDFGRDNLSVAILSAINSMIVAIVLTVLAFMVSGSIAFAAMLSRSKWIKSSLRAIGTLVESCPVIVWLFVIIVGLRDESRLVVVTIAFILAAIPYLTNVIYGELERIWHAEFVESARIAGLGEWRIGLRFILPNTTAVITPVFINVYGAALTVNGVIGVLGMGNRMDLEIGIMLLRAKESISTQPQIMVLAIAALIMIFGVMVIVGQEIKKKAEGEKGILYSNVLF